MDDRTVRQSVGPFLAAGWQLFRSASWLILMVCAFWAVRTQAVEGKAVEVAAGDDVLAQLSPPATPAERALLAGVQAENRTPESKAVRIRKLIATRQYFRQLRAEFPSLTEDTPSREACKQMKQPPSDVSFDFVLDDDDGSVLYRIKLLAKSAD